MPAGTFLPPGLTTSDVKIASGGTDNYVMTAVDGETIQGEANLTFDGSDLTLGNNIGIVFGDAGEKIEGDGTHLTIASSSNLTLTAGNVNITPTGDMNLTAGNFKIGGSPAGDGKIRLENAATIGWAGASSGQLTFGLNSSDIFAFSGDVAIKGVTPTLTIGDAGAEDTRLIFDGNAVDYHIGLDDTQDNLVIGKGTALGTTPIMSFSLSDSGDPNVQTEMIKIDLPTNTALAADTSFYKVRIGRDLITTAPSGTTPLIAQLRVDKPAITATGTVTTSATVYIEGAATEATNDYALFVDAGVSRFDGGTLIGATTSLNNLIDDASGGSGSTTLYIGDETITTSSDERLKTGIRPTQANAMDLVNRFNVVDFEWDDPTDTAEYDKNYRGSYTGMLAQETVKIAPWIINDQGGGRDCAECLAGQDCEEHGMWIVSYQNLVPTLVKAIQELNEKIQELEHGNR